MRCQGGVLQDFAGEGFWAIEDRELGGHADQQGEVLHEAVSDPVEALFVFQEAAGFVVSQLEPAVEGGQGADPFVGVLFAAGRQPRGWGSTAAGWGRWPR